MRLLPSSYTSVRSLFYLLLIASGVALGIWLSAPSPSDEQIKETIITSLQQEADTTVFVTGYLTISTRLTLEETRRFPRSDELPRYTVPLFHAAGTPQINLGTNRTALQVPGRVSYGFSLENLGTEDIEIINGRTIRMNLPALEIYSVEPELERLSLETELGWARWSSSGRELERRALGDIRASLRRQGQRHLRQSEQPVINTMRGVRRLLAPALKPAGIEEPRFEFRTPAMHMSLPAESGSSGAERQ